MKSHMKKIGLMAAAAVFFLLGVVGLLIPVIPQIPFFIMSVLCLSMASGRFKRWLVGTNLYQKHLKSHVEKHPKLSEFLHET